ncbi:hypothetical protein Tco_1410350 [Tanacetum coccineum]
MEALIEYENAMDKVADTVQDHKRKHDDDEYDDDEDPPARPNQGKKTKRRRTKDSESSKKPSTTKEIPKGKASSKGSKTGKSALAKEPVEEPIAEVVMDDAGNDVVHDDDQLQDASEPKTTKTLYPDWFKQPLMPLTPDPERNKGQVVLEQPEQPWFNQMFSAIKDPFTFDDLMATPIYFSKLDWNNPKGDCYPFDLSKPLPLQGHPGHLTIAVDYFFNNDLEYLKSSDRKERILHLSRRPKQLEDMDQDSTHMVAASKVPMLKPENGNTTPKTTVVEGVEKVMPPTTAEEKAQKRLEDAKLLMEAVEKRFGGNAATKKTQRNLLKQQYENFTAPSSEMLDQTFDRLQKLVSQLELLGETISQEDVNQKLLRSLSPK